MSKLPENCDACAFYNNRCLHADANSVDTGDGSALPKRCPLKEDTLDGKRFRVNYRGEKFYLVITELEGAPWEVFVEHAINSKPSLQYMMAGWDTCTRFVSLCLKCYGIEKTMRQLEKSSRLKDDLPGIIYSKLEEWVC